MHRPLTPVEDLAPTKMEHGRLPRGRRAAALASAFALLSFQMELRSAAGFSTAAAVSARTARRPRPSLAPLHYVETPDANALPTLSGSLADRSLHEFELKDHKPLGCSVEESVADEADGAKHVFVTDIGQGGSAHKAGLRVGDVIVQMSGAFDEVVDVAGLGIEKIRSLVGGRLAESPLVLRVARGSDVMARHELALVELCIVGDDAAAADCIACIYAADDDADLYAEGDAAAACCQEDDGAECMLNAMWSGWSEGLVPIAEEREAEVPVAKKKKVAPWSSRSSPSGTYVLDPKTGILVNIDE